MPKEMDKDIKELLEHSREVLEARGWSVSQLGNVEIRRRPWHEPYNYQLVIGFNGGKPVKVRETECGSCD